MSDPQVPSPQQPPYGQQPQYLPPQQQGGFYSQQPGGPSGPYPWQQPAGQPPMPPRKSHRTRNIVLGIVGALVLIIVIAAVASNGNNNTSASSLNSAANNLPAVQTTTSAPAEQVFTDPTGGKCVTSQVTNNYCPGDSPAPPAATTQHANGSGNQVITVSGLVPGTTYTLSYTASGSGTNALIVIEGQDNSLVNDINDSGTLSGSVLYTADAASITLQVQNADGETWALTFTPS